LVSILPSPHVLSSRPSVGGAHRPLGVFAANGPGIKTSDAGELSILDIAPTVLHSLGLPVPKEMQGAVAERIYDPQFLELHPVHRAAAPSPYRQRMENNGSAAAPMEDEEVVLDRLRELGYIE